MSSPLDVRPGYVQRLGEVASGRREATGGVGEPEPESESVDEPELPAGALDTALSTLIERCRAEVDHHPVQLKEIRTTTARSCAAS